jgi:hypothetical protein
MEFFAPSFFGGLFSTEGPNRFVDVAVAVSFGYRAEESPLSLFLP